VTAAHPAARSRLVKPSPVKTEQKSDPYAMKRSMNLNLPDMDTTNLELGDQAIGRDGRLYTWRRKMESHTKAETGALYWKVTPQA
jgi:hypothetical protein